MHFRLLHVVLILTFTLKSLAADAPKASLFSHDNLIAWCIVPFDAKKRSPEDRAAMLERLGITHFAYDWRKEHLPTFDQEIDALNRHHVELSAVWFPTSLDADAHFILDVLKKHGIKTELWVIAAGTPLPNEADAAKNVEAAVKM